MGFGGKFCLKRGGVPSGGQLGPRHYKDFLAEYTPVERLGRPAKTELFESGLTENKCEIDLRCQIEIASSGPANTHSDI